MLSSCFVFVESSNVSHTLPLLESYITKVSQTGVVGPLREDMTKNMKS